MKSICDACETVALCVRKGCIPITGADDGVACSDHPDAPHGFNRNASHTLHRYVCDCEGWSPEPQLKKELA